MIFLKRRALMTRASFNYKTVSGIGSAVLENCVETKFKRLSLFGNSAQTTTKGLQLLDKTKIPTPQAGVAYYNMQVEEGKYTLSTKYRRAVQKDLFLFAGEVDTGASTNINGVDSTISRTVESINGYITIGYRKGENGVNPFDFETMLNKGDTPLPYEPYTDGKPSPSVEYPQEIVSAGKYDEVSGKYAIDVSVTGKNLLDLRQMLIFNVGGNTHEVKGSNCLDVHGSRYTWFKFKTIIGKKYTITCQNITNGSRIEVYKAEKPDSPTTENFISSIGSISSVFKKLTFVSKSDAINLYFYPDVNIMQQEYCNIMISESDDLSYEPYHEPQTIQLQLDEPLRGIGEYKDVVTKDGILRRIKEIVLDESTGFETYWATLDKTFAFISPIIKDATVINFTPNRLLCNYFKVLPYGLDGTDEEVCVLFNRRFHMRFLKERNIDTVEKLKEWLKQNPIKIQYLLQEPVLEPFENNLGNLYTNDGTTIVSVDSGEVETGIEVEYAVKS